MRLKLVLMENNNPGLFRNDLFPPVEIVYFYLILTFIPCFSVSID